MLQVLLFGSLPGAGKGTKTGPEMDPNRERKWVVKGPEKGLRKETSTIFSSTTPTTKVRKQPTRKDLEDSRAQVEQRPRRRTRTRIRTLQFKVSSGFQSSSGAWCAVPACRALLTGQRSPSRQTVLGVVGSSTPELYDPTR